MTGCTVGRYEQLETSPETIEQELRPAVCEHRQTDLRRIIVEISENAKFYTLIVCFLKQLYHFLLSVARIKMQMLSVIRSANI